MSSALYQLYSDGNPIFVGVDYGVEEYSTECEAELLPDGTIRILDIRITSSKQTLQPRQDRQ